MTEIIELADKVILGEKKKQLFLIKGGFGVGKSQLLKLCIKQILDKKYPKFHYDEEIHVLINQMSPIDR